MATSMAAQAAVSGSALSFSANCSTVKGLGHASINAMGPSSATTSRRDLQVRAMAPKKKVNAFDDGWSKQWFGAGMFAENTETDPVNILKILEKKKLLSRVEKAGLLSKLEKAGLSLSQIERLGLLSKAEDLGLLNLAEKFASSSPATLASLALPLIVAGIAIPVFVPDDSQALVIGQNVVAVLSLATAGALFIGSIVLSGLQEED